MTLNEVETRVAHIRLEAEFFGEEREANNLRIALYVSVLNAIAAGATDAARLAREALRSPLAQ